MRRNIIWMIFLGIVAACALWFIIVAGHSVYSYFQLTDSAVAQIEKWEVEEIKSDQFAVVATYSYAFQGKIYPGKGLMKELYPNPWAANRAQKKYSTQQWQVWFNPKHPQQAVLEKSFPYKKALSAVVLIGLLIYFLILSMYVRMKGKNGR